MKRIMSILLVAVMVAVFTAVPAMAAEASTSDFANFPATGSQYASTYKAQTVAVQRFLMCHSTYNSTRLSANGGTDGYFGTMTTTVTKEYQDEKDLTIDGKVGPATWTSIGNNLTEVGVDSIGPVFKHKGYDVLIIGSDSNGTGYMACTDKSTVTGVFYYI